ncbi:hypothetical protein RN001_005406 [Aquatica leii]|uniref:Phospholipase A2 n=1 Tax=Aquatica leii TaxID=1421715 RepID=A0AAN7PBW4_9COLE|nr:hypothetical protein RN001_005406 [Aquatica leii]
MKLLFLILITAVTTQIEAVDNRNPQESTWLTMSSPGNGNVTIYLGYANNPFGPSIHFSNENVKSNATNTKNKSAQYGKASNLKTSEENFIDTGQNMSIANRRKRGVIHLYNMVSCATGCNPLIYKGYGCYCGFLGSGYPVDGIDRCCRRHDSCYDASNCPAFLEYFVPFYWKCFNNKPYCGVDEDEDEWGGPGSCAYRICQCDRMLSECLSKYPCPSSRALCRSSPVRLLQNALMIF